MKVPVLLSDTETECCFGVNRMVGCFCTHQEEVGNRKEISMFGVFFCRGEVGLLLLFMKYQSCSFVARIFC